MPITATMPRRSLESSTRMPASLRLSSSISFGHFEAGAGNAQRRQCPCQRDADGQRETGQPLDAAVKAPQDGEGQARRGRRLPESAPAAAPAVCRSTTSTLPEPAPRDARSSSRSLDGAAFGERVDVEARRQAPSSGFSRAGSINAAVMGALSPRTVPALQAPATAGRWSSAHESVRDRYKARIVEIGGVLVERADHLHGTVARLATLAFFFLPAILPAPSSSSATTRCSCASARASSLQLATMLPTSCSTFFASAA